MAEADFCKHPVFALSDLGKQGRGGRTGLFLEQQQGKMPSKGLHGAST